MKQTKLLRTGSRARKQYCAAIIIAAATLGTAQAADPGKSDATIFDNIWSHAELYKDKENPVIQSLKFTGRFQLDYANINSDHGFYDEWNIRRFRMGAKAALFHDITLHVEADVNPQEPRPFYQRLTDAYIAWSPDPSFGVTLGKHGAAFTMDGQTSSKELLTIDRNNLANNLWFPEEYIPGVTVGGKKNNWVYSLGVFSSGSADGEFGDFDGGVFGLGTIGYDFAKALDVKKALLRANYLYNEKDSNNGFTRALQHVGSLNFDLDLGKWGVRTDLAAGAGYLGQSDLWGAMVMPYYNLTEKLQAVARYTYLSSDDPNGVRLARYENQFVSGRGDEYSEGYLGLNYYIYGHKLKLQTGIQYADMKDKANDGGNFDGWSWTSGLRISW